MKKINLLVTLIFLFTTVFYHGQLVMAENTPKYPITIKQISVESEFINGVNTIVNTPDSAGLAKALVAIYQDNRLINFSLSLAPVPYTETGELFFPLETNITYNDEQLVKVFIWSCDIVGNITMIPLSEEYNLNNNITTSPEPIFSEIPETTTEPELPKPTTEPEPSASSETPASPSASPSEYNDIIHLNGNYIEASGIDGIVVNGKTVTILSPGEYTIEGTLDDGQIIVSCDSKSDEITINLNGVDIYCSSAEPFSALKGKVTLKTVENTINTFTDNNENQSENRNNGCIYSKNDLTITGAGTLNINANYSNGIRCKADVEIKGGVRINVNAVNNGIKADESFTSKKTTIDIICGNDGIKTDCTDDDTKGYINITNANSIINITTTGTTDDPTGGDGIQADRSITIGNGEINITSNADGIKAGAEIIDETSGDIAEIIYGIINIWGGTTTINSDEDGIQSNYLINISDGTVSINKAAEDGIRSKSALDSPIEPYTDGFITVSGGNINIISDQDAIQADSTLDISGGILNITAGNSLSASAGTINKDSVDYSCKGIKGCCSINISSGTITVDSFDDSIHSNGTTAIRGGTLLLSSADDGIHSDTDLTITGDTTSIDILKSYEGLEAYTITINNGKIHITASDDGINSAGGNDTSSTTPGHGGRPGQGVPGGNSGNNGMINLDGGYIFVNAGGDGLDSNGSMQMSAGTVIICGPTDNSNGALDFDGTFSVTGGFMIAAGSSGMVQTPTKSDICFANITFSSAENSGKPGQQQSSLLSSGTIVHIEDSMGNDILTFSPEKAYNSIVFISPEMKSGEKYTVYSGGSCTDYTSLIDGLYNGGYYADSGSASVQFSASASGTNVSIKQN